MFIAFLIWSLVFVVFIVLGIRTCRAKDAAGFFANEKPPVLPAEQIRPYNHAVAKIWFVYGILFEILGIPLLYLQQNSPLFILPVLGTMVWVIGLIITYLKVQKRYENKP